MKPQTHSGIALFLVLWVLTLLSVIVGEFCHSMRTEIHITRNFKEETEAYYIALAGINTAIAKLIENESRPRNTRLSEEQAEKDDQIEWRINIELPEISFAQGRFKVKIGNESGKININTASKKILNLMLNDIQLEDEEKNIIVDSILDWRDKNHLHRVNGAEDEYYLSLSEPYECKDGDFDSVEEMRLVKGITREIFEKLKHKITIYKDESSSKKRKKKKSKKKKSSLNKININAASAQMLADLPDLTEELVQEIIKYREEKDFKSLSELAPILGPDIYAKVVSYLSVKKSRIFTIQSLGMLNHSDIMQRVEAVVKIDTKLKKKYQILKWLEN